MGSINKGLNRLTMLLILGSVLWISSSVSAKTADKKDNEVSKKSDSSVTADEKSDEDAKLKAKESYDIAKKAFNEKNYEAAKEAFKQAYNLKPHPAVLKMIAECNVLLNNFSDAIYIYLQLMDVADYNDKEKISQQIEDIKSKVGLVSISTNPEGAAISIDGSFLTDTTPKNIYLNPGEHTIVISLTSYPEQEKKITVVKGETNDVTIDFSAIKKVPAPALIDPFAEDDGDVQEENPEDTPEQNNVEDNNIVTKIPGAFWAMAAVTGIGVVSGTVFGTMALKDSNDYKDSGSDATKTSGERSALIADISFGVAIAAAITGTIILITNKNKKEKLKSATKEKQWNIIPVFGQNQAGISTAIQF
ncbi:MAG: PEGA domain-containing protein [Deltaproteobacteria bacterium]|nr:PEGA domain-containing protein [Deltaproteobacteria bacterium]